MTRKRKRKNADGDSHVKTPSLIVQPQPQQPVLNDSDPLEFCVLVEPSGTVIRIGSFYTLGFSVNSLYFHFPGFPINLLSSLCFVHLLTRRLTLLLDVVCSVGDAKHISCSSNLSFTSNVRNHVDKIICKGWERVSSCQERNIGNVLYLLDHRKSCLASQMHQGVWSGISRSATQPSQPIHLGLFDPVLDAQIFGLSSKNQFQVIYIGKDIAKLDSLLGALRDINILMLYARFASLCISHPWACGLILPTRSQMLHSQQIIRVHVYISCKFCNNGMGSCVCTC